MRKWGREAADVFGAVQVGIVDWCASVSRLLCQSGRQGALCVDMCCWCAPSRGHSLLWWLSISDVVLLFCVGAGL